MLEILLELVLQLAGELLLEAGLGSTRHITFRIAVLAAIGAAIGALTLLLFPTHFIRNADLRLLSLFVTPVICGGVFAYIGRRRLRKGKEISALDEFTPAFAFALAFAVVRYFGAA